MRELTINELFEVSAGFNTAGCYNAILAWSGVGALVGAAGGVLGGEFGFVAGGAYAQLTDPACA